MIESEVESKTVRGRARAGKRESVITHKDRFGSAQSEQKKDVL